MNAACYASFFTLLLRQRAPPASAPRSGKRAVTFLLTGGDNLQVTPPPLHRVGCNEAAACSG
jgi:hypothetical protein